MGKKYDGRAADVWSMGVVLYALLTGKLPFDHDDIRRLLTKVKTGVFTMPTSLPETIKDLLWKMLTVDPTKRITIEMIKAHPALQLSAPFNSQIQYPAPLPSEITQPVDLHSSLDEEIVRSLQALGWGDSVSLQAALASPTPSFQKVFYRLLQERKNDKNNSQQSERSSPYPVTQPQSIPSYPVSSPFAIPGRSPASSSPISIGGRLGLGIPTSSPVSNSPIIGSSPKKTWFSSLFSSFKEKPPIEERERSIGTSSSFTLKTTSAPDEIMTELQQALQSLQIIFQPTQPNLLLAKYDGPDVACAVEFSVEVVVSAEEGLSLVPSSIHRAIN